MARTLGGGVLPARPAAVPARGRTARHPPRHLPPAVQGAVTARAADLIRRPPTPAIVAEDVASRGLVAGEAAAALRPEAGAIATAAPPRAQDRTVGTRSPARGRTWMHIADAAAAIVPVEEARAGVVRCRLLLRRRGRRMRMAHRAHRPQTPPVGMKIAIAAR